MGWEEKGQKYLTSYLLKFKHWTDLNIIYIFLYIIYINYMYTYTYTYVYI